MSVTAGLSSQTGRRPRNEDYAGVIHAGPGHGTLAALADGVGGHRGGRVAAELVVRAFIDAYLDQNPALGVRRLAARALEPLNAWVHAIGRVDPDLDAMACTFTALILRGRVAHVVHVGDSRLYRLRDGRLHRLTTDHALDRPGLTHVLTRAVGLSTELAIDWDSQALLPSDRFLLCSDGVHGTLRDRSIAALLARGNCEQAAADLVQAALQAGSGDNVTACVIEATDLPPPEQGDIELALASLPFPGDLRAGQTIDGFALERLLSESRNSRVFLARDTISAIGGRLVLKTARSQGPDPMLRQAIAREAWIMALVRSPWLAEMIDIPPERRGALYLAMPYYDGETLERRLGRPPRVSLPEGLAIAIRLAKAVAALHRAGIIHRDIKPENVVLTKAGGLRLLDLGVARLPNLEPAEAAPLATIPPGTASYSAPELLAGTEQGSEASDQFALGVTLFRLFTNDYPYGEIEPFSHPRFSAPASLTRIRADLPPWLDQVLRRAISVPPEARYGDVIEFIFALEHGAEQPVLTPAKAVPLFARDPVRSWQVLCALLALLLLLALAWKY